MAAASQQKQVLVRLTGILQAFLTYEKKDFFDADMRQRRLKGVRVIEADMRQRRLIGKEYLHLNVFIFNFFLKMQFFSIKQ